MKNPAQRLLISAESNALVRAEQPHVKPGRLLVIDDSLTIRTLVSLGLRRAGYDVLTFSTGLQALHWLQSSVLLPALILLDINLPRLSGYQLARLLKQHPVLAGIPFILISCRDGVLDQVKGKVVGAKAYVVKPFRIERLVALIRTVLDDEHQELSQQGAEHEQ